MPIHEGEDEVIDSPTGWVAKHIEDYVTSDGARGHRWRGVDTLLLTTRGRRTGRLRRTALIYGVLGDRFVVVGSKGGAARHPEWYLNLVDDPHVDVQVGAERFGAHAETVRGEERESLWSMMAAIWPQYEVYEERTRREIPVVALQRL